MNKLIKKEIIDVLAVYGLVGKNIKIVENTNGFANKTYIISIEKNKFVLRKSNPNTKYNHIKLEVSLLNYLHKQNFNLTPQVLLNIDGQNITKFNNSFFILQTFVSGETRASWNDLTKLNTKMFRSFFATVANFSKVAEGFDFKHSITNKPVWYYVKNAHKILNDSLKAVADSDIKKYLITNKTNIDDFIIKTRKEFLEAKYDSLPKQIVHFDWHPGNVHFKNDKVVGVFDFDWARWDSHITDLAAAIGQSCYYYGGKRDGLYRKDRIQIGIQSYRQTYGKSKISLQKENSLIKIALKGYMLFQFFWSVSLFAEKPTKENAVVLKHFLNVLLLNDFDYLFDFSK